MTLLGRNGAGKTTTLKSIMGMVGKRGGIDAVSRARNDRPAPRTRSRGAGIAICPEERGIFASLDVSRKISMLPPVVRPGGLSLDEIFDAVPQSQGTAEQPGHQAVRAASSRCWRSRASCAPARACCCSTSRPRAWRRSSSSRSAAPSARLRSEGFTILLVEQNFRFAATVADRYLRHGAWQGRSTLFANAELAGQHGQAARLSRRVGQTAILACRSDCHDGFRRTL